MELKSTVAKMRNSPEGFKAAFGHIQESGNLKDRPMEITDWKKNFLIEPKWPVKHHEE